MYSVGDIFYEDDDYGNKAVFCNERGYEIVEIEADEGGRRFQIREISPLTQEELNEHRHAELKVELEKVMEDIEQEQLGIVRDDYAEKRARAAEIINELRVLEGKEAREVRDENN